MCLDTITKTGLNRSGIGWKVFSVGIAGFHSECMGEGEIIPKNRWLKAEKVRIRINENTTYTSGFHVFLKRKDAQVWKTSGGILLKVKYREGHTTGKQSPWWSDEPLNIIVADEMLILPLKKGAK